MAQLSARVLAGIWGLVWPVWAQCPPPDGALSALRRQHRAVHAQLQTQKGRPQWADAAVYAKAVEWFLRYPAGECHFPDTVQWAKEALDTASQRAGAAEAWPPGRWHVHGYVSRVDGSVQPYAVYVPAARDGRQRLDVVLHGRNDKLTELSFLRQHTGTPKNPPRHLTLKVFGRTNNAYRWAGEQDVFEALSAVQARYPVDPQRIVLRGFSMGGAGAWHLGLHYPSRWAAVEAGAGFTDTKRYQKIAGALPFAQEATLTFYDALPVARNAALVPVVGYGGELDPQLQAAVNIREALSAAGFRFAPEPGAFRGLNLAALFLVGPQTQHKWHPESQRLSDAFLDEASAAPRADGEFVAFTPAHGEFRQLRIEALDRWYEAATLRVQRGHWTTSNVAELRVGAAAEVDGQKLEPGVYRRQAGQWRKGAPAGLRKHAGVTGPIDDAFRDSFVVVIPEGIDARLKQRAEEFLAAWRQYLRGDPPVVSTVEEALARNHHLVLFGDPESNAYLKKIAAQLPVRWTREGFTLAGLKASRQEAFPVLIYPNPLHPSRYVVLNSGHTFGAAQFQGSNAQLYPRLGDWGVVRFEGGIAASGLFDRFWRAKLEK